MGGLARGTREPRKAEGRDHEGQPYRECSHNGDGNDRGCVPTPPDDEPRAQCRPRSQFDGERETDEIGEHAWASIATAPTAFRRVIPLPRSPRRPAPSRIRRNAASRRDDLPVRVPAVPGAADHRQADPALVRRHRGGLDHLHGVLPDRCCWSATPTRTAIDAELAPRAQAALHIGAARRGLAFAADLPADAWKPPAHENPIVRILLLLAATIGLPYFLLASTSPLLQAWFARALPGVEPVPPVRAVEPRLAAGAARLPVPVRAVARQPASRPGVVVGSSLRFAVLLRRLGLDCTGTPCGRRSAPAQAQDRYRRDPTRRARPSRSGWRSSATGSVMLLAVTNHVTQNVASIPLLWVVPLTLYLLTFILCFEGRRWYRRDAYLGLRSSDRCACMAWFLADKQPTSSSSSGSGRRVRRGPVRRLHVLPRRARAPAAGAAAPHAFYLMVSLGGAIGGAAGRDRRAARASRLLRARASRSSSWRCCRSALHLGRPNRVLGPCWRRCSR